MNLVLVGAQLTISPSTVTLWQPRSGSPITDVSEQFKSQSTRKEIEVQLVIGMCKENFQKTI